MRGQDKKTDWTTVLVALATGLCTLLASAILPWIQSRQENADKRSQLEWMLVFDAYRINGLRQSSKAIVAGLTDLELSQDKLLVRFHKSIPGLSSEFQFVERYDTIGSILSGDSVSWIVGQMSLLGFELRETERKRKIAENFQNSVADNISSIGPDQQSVFESMRINFIDYRNSVIAVEERCAYIQAAIRATTRFPQKSVIEYPLNIEIPLSSYSWQTSISARFFDMPAKSVLDQGAKGVAIEFTPDDSVGLSLITVGEPHLTHRVSVRDCFFKVL